MKWILISVVILLAGCYLESRQPVNLDPVVEAVAPVAVELFVPEPWRTLGLLALGGLGVGGVGAGVRKLKKNAK